MFPSVDFSKNQFEKNLVIQKFIFNMFHFTLDKQNRMKLKLNLMVKGIIIIISDNLSVSLFLGIGPKGESLFEL